MEKTFIRKKQSTILLALLIIIGLSLPVTSITPIPAIGTINNIPALPVSPADNNIGGGIIGQSLSIPFDLAAVNGNETNNTGHANKTTNQSASNQSALIPNPAGTGLSYADFNFKANASQISSMPLLYRMWRNTHFTDTMGRAFAGDMSYPLWILPTEYTSSAIEMHNWNTDNAVGLAYTLPGTHLTPRFWPLGITAPNNPTVSGLSQINIGGQIPHVPNITNATSSLLK